MCFETLCVYHLNITSCVTLTDMRCRSDINSVAAQQHETWATLGFLRGVSTTKRSGRAFCTQQWIELMMEVIKGASPLAKSKGSRSKSLVQQVSSKLCLYKLYMLTSEERCCEIHQSIFVVIKATSTALIAVLRHSSALY